MYWNLKEWFYAKKSKIRPGQCKTTLHLRHLMTLNIKSKMRYLLIFLYNYVMAKLLVYINLIWIMLNILVVPKLLAILEIDYLDVKRSQDGLFVRQSGVIIGWNLQYIEMNTPILDMNIKICNKSLNSWTFLLLYRSSLYFFLSIYLYVQWLVWCQCSGSDSAKKKKSLILNHILFYLRLLRLHSAKTIC